MRFLQAAFFPKSFSSNPFVVFEQGKMRMVSSVWQSVAMATVFFSSSSRTVSDALPFGRRSDDDEKNRNAAVEMYVSTGDAASSHLLFQEIREQASALQAFLVDTRRTLHQRPELMYQEEETSEIIQSLLKGMDVKFTTGWAINKHPDVNPGPGGYGIVADIGTGEEPCVLLRADMDALPIQERTPIDFRSQRDNTMHACGHDGHTTMLLGAASILKAMEHSLNGTVVSND
jgi:hypothetical protein